MQWAYLAHWFESGKHRTSNLPKNVLITTQLWRQSPSAAADPVQVCLGHLGEVEVDDDVDGLDVDTAGEEVAAHEVAAQAGAEVVEHSVTVSLESRLVIQRKEII